MLSNPLIQSYYSPSKLAKSRLLPRLSTGCSTLGQWLLQILAPSGEPSIAQILCNGQLYWEAYDPYLEKTIRFGSETEVRVWLDQQQYC
ncbi:MAG: hypothetical protein AAFV72_15540 [Cyanobacteria bacterium J06635_1]